MKPKTYLVFNLEAAKRGEPIQCRDGTPAKFIAHVPEAHPTQKIVVLLGDNIYGYFESGQRAGIKNDPADLFMAPKKRTKRTVWLNFYPMAKTMILYGPYESEAQADEFHLDSKRTNRIGNRAYPVEIEE